MNSNNTYRDYSPALVHGDVGAEVPDPVLEIVRAIAADIHAFLGRWSTDHQGPEKDESCSQSEHALRQQIIEFQSQKADWEAKRARDAQQMQESMNHLTESWLRLEAEQRALRVAGNNNPTNAHPRSAVTAGETILESSDRGLRNQTISGRVSGNVVPGAATADFSFQQLQREVESRRRPERPV